MSAGETWIVTGGTGALGSAIVAHALGRSARVVVPWIVTEERDRLADAQAAAIGNGSLSLLEADVAEAEGAQSVVDAAGEPRVLVNGVGGFGGGTPVHETALDLFDRMHRMNVRTAAAMARAVAPGMIARRDGVIISVASQAALDPPAGLAAYSIAKAGIVVLTRTLQAELGDHGVRVNAVVPSTIDTPANRDAMPDADFAQWTPPRKIAEVVAWLASDSGATVRGGLIPV